MEIKEIKPSLKKLIADEGKILISKTLDDLNNPTIIAKEIYLGSNSSENYFIEIEENKLVLNEK